MSNNNWVPYESDLKEFTTDVRSPAETEVNCCGRSPAPPKLEGKVLPRADCTSILDDVYGPPTCHGESVSGLSKWSARFLQLAALVASWSKDPTTQVGAIAANSSRRILETGYNGLPQGVEDLEPRFQRPAKYLWTTHAEANLVASAASVRLRGSTVYVTHLCCAQCAALLINSGVARVVCGTGITSMAPEQFDVALRMFEEAQVELVIEEVSQ